MGEIRKLGYAATAGIADTTGWGYFVDVATTSVLCDRARHERSGVQLT